MARTAQDITNLEKAINDIITNNRRVSFTTIDSSYTNQALDLNQARLLLAEMKLEVNAADSGSKRRSRIFRTRHSKGL